MLLVHIYAWPTTGDTDGPVINVWYGSHQVFGQRGMSQRWVNILGNAADADGIAALTYSLNASPAQPLSLGPDVQRLVAPGDFNVEIALTALRRGRNHVSITATDTLRNVTTTVVTLVYSTGTIWPLPYAIDWSKVTHLQDVVQVVDGLWTLNQHGIRPIVPGYDRLIAIGDISWSDYEVTVPVTVHGIDETGFRWPSVAPGVGLILRWQGHYDWGGAQPTIGYKPVGATLWYGWEVNRFFLRGDHGLKASDPARRKLEFERRYYYKMRVQTVANDPQRLGWYKAKIWSETEPEPATWTLQGREHWQELSQGSLLLVAHHVDATFGNVRIVPLEPLAPRSSVLLRLERAYDFGLFLWRAAKQYLRQLVGGK
jgi:hypothetical protein